MMFPSFRFRKRTNCLTNLQTTLCVPHQQPLRFLQLVYSSLPLSKGLMEEALLVRPLSCSAWTSRTWLTPHVEARKDATVKAKAFVAQLETVEKIGLVTGGYGQGAALPCVGSISAIERLNFTGLCYSDGPSGYGRADGVSVFPSGITVAATWDSDLMYERGVALGEEFRDKGSHVHLGYDRTTLCKI